MVLDPSARPQLRALVVDDVPEICAMYRALFRRVRGIDVELVTETDAQASLKLLRDDAFDLVISDFRMKNADGVDVLSAAYARNPSGRRVLMTGYNEVPTTIERIRAARIDAYLHKPLRAQDVLLLVSAMLVGDADSVAEYRSHAAELEEIALREDAATPASHPESAVGA